jgi:hypothetical protein
LKEITALHNITLRDIVNRIKEIRSWPMATIIRTGTHTVAITQDERDFFIELG